MESIKEFKSVGQMMFMLGLTLSFISSLMLSTIASPSFSNPFGAIRISLTVLHQIASCIALMSSRFMTPLGTVLFALFNKPITVLELKGFSYLNFSVPSHD